jgi:hypothetical protein
MVTAPLPLTSDELPTDVDALMVHWGLELGLRGRRTVEEARRQERKASGSARAAFERMVDRRSGDG